MGDETWTSLFPGHFVSNMTFPYESFNAWDLHTLDNGVLTHLIPLVKRKEEWDVLIAHFLGVDHAGHRYGPNHEAMNDKLKQMDSVITQLVQHIDEDTLLVVMGDHGMDPKGDHGGDSPGEVEAALWMYSKRPSFGRIKNSPSERSIAQIDLVPTLSLLLGLPIPFNNLGGPIPEAFLRPGKSYQSLATAARITAGQIRRYQEMYKASGKVDLGPQFEQRWHPAESQSSLIQSWSEKKAKLEWEGLYQSY
jgi:GPI ethanolamine phosphate transferase 3 subunit O